MAGDGSRRSEAVRRARELREECQRAVRGGSARRGVQALRDSVEIWRELAAAWPDRYLHDLAFAQCELAPGLEGPERVAMAEEALANLRRLAASQPDKYLEDVSAALHGLANAHESVGDDAAAEAAIDEEIEVWRQLVRADPKAHLFGLSCALNRRHVFEEKAGRWTDAIETLRELSAIELERGKSDPRSLSLAAANLHALARRLRFVGREEEGVEPLRAAIDIYRRLVALDPDLRYQRGLADALTDLCRLHEAQGRAEEALMAAAEAVAVQRELAAADPMDDMPNFAGLLELFARCARALRRDREAHLAEHESEKIWALLRAGRRR